MEEMDKKEEQNIAVKDDAKKDKEIEKKSNEEKKETELENKETKNETTNKDEKFEQLKANSKKAQKDINKIEDNMEIKETKNKMSKKKKLIISIIIIATIIIIALILSTIFALININNIKIMSGVKIQGIDVSGLTQEEAKGKLETIYNEKEQKEIPIKYQEFESSINPTMIEVNYDIEGSVNEAYKVGRDGNIFVNNYNIILALLNKKNIDVNMNLNEDAAKKAIEDIGSNLPGVMVESSYYIEGEELIITKGKSGVKIDTDNLLNQIKDRLKSIELSDEYIDIPVVNADPTPIDIDKIHSEIYKEMQNAYYTKDPFTIYPEVEGVDFNVDEAKALIAAEDKEEYVIKLTITKPTVTTNDIGTEAFPDKLGTCTTRYDARDTDRTTNLKLACEKLNNKVVLAGETFSYNKTLGERTIAAGYKNAKVYENGQVVDGIGGGICQISSTLYNAVIDANLDIVERRNHQFVTSYIAAGKDATVVYGTTDFRFKNTRKYPIKILASVQNGIATISIYGIKEDVEYDVTLEVKQISTIPYTTKYVDDASLAVGTEKVKQKGSNGLKTETYLVKRLNGKVVSSELISRDTYNAMQRIVLRGTKGASSSSSNSNSNSNSNTNTNTSSPANTTNNNSTSNTNTTNQNTTNTSNTSGTDNNQNKTSTSDNKDS